MDNDRLITVAIHTYERAVQLKNLLESEGVSAVLHNVNLSNPVVSSGVRVRIHESDLPLALRIIENTDIFSTNSTEVDNHAGKIMLVPIDFSDYSTRACDIAFDLAYKHKAMIVLLNTFLDPYVSANIQLDDTLNYDPENVVVEQTLLQEAKRRMDDFARKLRSRIKSSSLPPVKFKTEILEGIPEEVITEYAKENKPELIVMGTREAGKKEKDLIGSVTAEVLDSCRSTVFTVPESVRLTSVDDIKHVVFFSNMEQEDILALDAFYRFFDTEHIKVTIAVLPGKKRPKDALAASRLLNYCTVHYPRYEFTLVNLSLSGVVDDFKAIEQKTAIDLIAVPNKKKNILARLFNPSIAHRLLFHSDISMVVIPV